MKNPNLQPEDEDLFGIIQYQTDKFGDDLLDAIPATVSAINEDRESEGLSTAKIVSDDLFLLPGGTYVQAYWELRTIPKEEGDALREELEEEDD